METNQRDMDTGRFLKINRWALNFDKCIKCNLTNHRHEAKGLCIYCYNLQKYALKNGNKYNYSKHKKCDKCGNYMVNNSSSNICIHCKSYPTKWASAYDKCISCNTTNIKHHAKGLCRKCYAINRSTKKGYKQRKSEYDRSYSLKHNEYLKSRKREYYQNHKSQHKVQMDNWRKENPQRLLEINYKSKTKRKFLLSGFDTCGIDVSLKDRLIKESQGVCIYCKNPLSFTKDVKDINQATIDHIYPLSLLDPKLHKFDPNEQDNLVISCRRCNAKKQERDIFEWCREQKINIPDIILAKLSNLKLTNPTLNCNTNNKCECIAQ